MMQRLLLEMRHRKVLRVAGAYAVAGWVMLQAAQVLMPALALPEWTVTFVAAVLLIGLPVSMAVAWAFQAPAVTPAAEADAAAAAPAAGLWIDLVLLLAVVLVVVVGALQLAGRAGAGAPRSVPAAADGASVAVLPFASFSVDRQDDYFADGLTEELINGLVQLPGLKVPGRTSSFHFKNRNEDLREIARQLGVAHVLEGSVRRAGNQLRVTVQLVSAEDGFHLWSQSYDRELTDVFAIQHDIARQVARTLQLTLLGDRPSPDTPAREVHPDLLVGMALLRERGLRAITEARAVFEQILRGSPDHAEALAGYAEATIVLAGAYLALEFEPAARTALDAVERARRLAPDSIPVNLAAAQVYNVLALRTEEQHYLDLAERSLSHAMDLAPNDPEVLRSYGGLMVRLERWDTALAVLERAADRDPLNRAVSFELAEALRGAGRLEQARTELTTLLARQPDFEAAHLELGEMLVESGGFEAALPHLRRAHRARTSPRATFALAHLYLNLGMVEAMRRTLDELDYAPLSRPLATMIEHLLSGDDARALAFAEAELARGDDGIWRPLVALLALTTGDLDKAREHLRRLEPALLAPRPDVTRMVPDTVLLAANLLLREGHEDAAAYLLEALLARFEPPPAGYDPIPRKLIRAQALAQLGRDEAAIAELSAARLQGYRTPFDFDYFLRLDRYPAFARVRGTQAFQALLAAIERDNRAVAARLAGAGEPGAARERSRPAR